MKIVLDNKNYHLFRRKGLALLGAGYITQTLPPSINYIMTEYALLEKPFFVKKDFNEYYIFNER